MPRKDAYTGPISAQAQQDLVSEGIENYELPKSIVMKIAKSSIPDNVKLQKETVLSLVKGSTVFINYLAATAHDVALSKQHKSISASDVLKALEMLEFTDMVEKLQGELQVYRQLVKTGEKKLEKKKSSIPATGPVPSNQSVYDAPMDVPMDVDTTVNEEDRHVDEQDVREDEEVVVEEGISEDDPILESDEGESNLLEDKVALEEEELRKDHQGLDEKSPTVTVMALHED